MRILQVIPAFLVAGAETMCANLSIELSKMGHNVLVVSLYNYQSSLTKHLENSNIRVVYLNKKKGIDLSIIRPIRALLCDFKPDIIHAHLYSLKYIVMADFGYSIKIVFTVHSVAQRIGGKLERWLYYFFFHFSFVTPVALSEATKETIHSSFNVSYSKIPIVNNGAPLDRVTEKHRYEFGEYISIIHIGRFNDVKNHREMIKAIISLHSIYPSIRLHLYGEGELQEEIRDVILSSNAEDYIFMHGITDDSFSVLQKSDIFLLPSKAEGMPMTLIEAMAVGLPIIASNVGGIPNMIENNKEGLLCMPNSDSIQGKLVQLINDKPLRERIAKAARDKSRLFSATNMAKNYLNLYICLVK